MESASNLKAFVEGELKDAEATLEKEKREAQQARQVADRKAADVAAAELRVATLKELSESLSPTGPVKPVEPTPTKPLTILPPSFVDGLLSWKSEGGDGTKPEFMAVGVSNWTDKPVKLPPLDKSFAPITIRARQSGKETTPLVYDLLKNQISTPPDKPTSKPVNPTLAIGQHMMSVPTVR